MLNIEHRVKQMRLNHVFNIVHDKAPLYMKNSFTLVLSSHHNTRSVGNMNFTLPYIKSCQDQTFYYNAFKDWNALPSSIKQLIKANMNSDKQLQTAAIFFITNFYLKQGIG